MASGLWMAALLGVCPAMAHANAGIPMLPVQYPTILWLLVPVVLIEAVYLQGALGTKWRRTLLAVSGANLATMALGYPLAWMVYTGLNIAIGFPVTRSADSAYAQWVPIWVCSKIDPGWPGMQDLWPLFGIFLALLVPSYLLSRYVKTWLVDGYNLLRYKGDSRHAIVVANRLSYLLLAATGCALLYRIYNRM